MQKMYFDYLDSSRFHILSYEELLRVKGGNSEASDDSDVSGSTDRTSSDDCSSSDDGLKSAS